MKKIQHEALRYRINREVAKKSDSRSYGWKIRIINKVKLNLGNTNKDVSYYNI